MANINVTPGTGKTVCTTTIGGFEYQNVILTDAAGAQAGAAVIGQVVVPAAPIPSTNVSSAYAHTAVTTPYAFGQAWLNNSTAGSVTFPTITIAKANDQAFSAIYFRLQKSGTVITNAIFRIHFSNVIPTTSVADLGAFATGISMTSGYLGYIDVTTNLQFADGTWGVGTIPAGALSGKPLSGAQTIYWVPEVRGAYTPISAETLTLYAVTQ